MKKIMLYFAVFVLFMSLQSCYTPGGSDKDPVELLGTWEVYSVTTDDDTEYTFPGKFSFDLNGVPTEASTRKYIVLSDSSFDLVDYIEDDLNETQAVALKDNYGFIDSYKVVRNTIDEIDKYNKTIWIDDVYSDEGSSNYQDGQVSYDYDLDETTLVLTGKWTYHCRRSSVTISDDVLDADYISDDSDSDSDSDGGSEFTFQTLELEKEATLTIQGGSYFCGKIDLVSGTRYFVSSDSFSELDLGLYTSALEVFAGSSSYSSGYSSSSLTLTALNTALFAPGVFSFTANQTGSFYLKVKDMKMQAVTLKVSASCVTALDSETGVSAGGASTKSYDAAKDTYYFKAQLTAATCYYFYCDKLNGNNLTITVLDDEFKRMTLTEKSTTLTKGAALYSYTPETSGVYYFVVKCTLNSTSSFVSDNKEKVTLNLSTSHPMVADHYSLDQEIQYSAGSAITFDAVAGTTYYIYTPYTKTFSYFSGAMYYGSVLTQDYLSRSDLDVKSFQVYSTYTAKATGKTAYYMNLYPSDSTAVPKYFISKSLPVTAGTVLTPVLTSTTPLKVASGTLSALSSDLYEINIDAGGEYYLYTSGVAYCSLALKKDGDTVGVTQINTGDRTNYSYRITDAGKYFLRVFSAEESHTGTYDLYFVKDDYSNYRNAGGIQPDSSTPIEMSPYSCNYSDKEYNFDYDCINLSVTATMYTIQTTGSVNTYGFLYSSPSSSTYVTYQGSGGDGDNFKIVYNVGTAGTYVIVIRGENKTISGSYYLSVTH